MAGDWIKLEQATLDKPEVALFSELLNIPIDQGVGLLVRFWVWLDQNSCNGSVTLMSRKRNDAVVHHPGFSDALEAVGWLKFDEETHEMVVPHFDRHNGKTAKSRALGKDRVQRFRNAHSNASVTQNALPEKRREEKNLNPSIFSPSIKGPNDAHKELARSLCIDVADQYQQFRDYVLAHGKRYKDEAAAFRNWLKKANGYANTKPALVESSSHASFVPAVIPPVVPHTEMPAGVLQTIRNLTGRQG